MKILNLYAGIGGNRTYWGEEHEITAIESDPIIESIYADRYPNDTTVVADAHQYLLEHYDEYDFIWSSPPCPSHSRMRYWVGVKHKGYNPLFPDMRLYEEVLFLKHHFDGPWCVENVRSYYEPLVSPQEVGRHYFWANFPIDNMKVEVTGIRSKNTIKSLEQHFGIDLSAYKLPNKRQVLRNCVEPQLAAHILDCATFPHYWIGPEPSRRVAEWKAPIQD